MSRQARAMQSDPTDHIASTVAFSGGWFEMGSNDGAPAEQPVHNHFVAPFEIDRHLVTNFEFAEFAATTGYLTEAEEQGSAWGYDGDRFCEVKGLSWRSFLTGPRQRHPVVLVSWHDAASYAAWKCKRLPTEAEWEFVARLAAEGNQFPWIAGDDPFANCAAGSHWENGPGTSPVGNFLSGAGVYDLVGNVWQWCADRYDDQAYEAYAMGSQHAAPNELDLRVRRGGAWNVMQAFRLRCSNRGAYLASRSAPNLGFRCAR